MKRRLLTCLSVISLTICVLMVLGWRGMLNGQKTISWPFGFYGPHKFTIELATDSLIVWHQTRLDLKRLYDEDPNALSMSRPIFNRVLLYDEMRAIKLPGQPLASSSLYVDHLLTIPLAALLPALWSAHFAFTRLRRRLRRRAQRCMACGYDLRATPDRCPECGIEVSKPQPA